MKIIVFAGGLGSRLWPLSQPFYPKPLLRLGSGYSFLQKTLLRFLGSFGADSLAVIAHQDYLQVVEQQSLEIDPKGQIVLIPERISRSTTVATALSILFLQEQGKLDEEEPLLLSPSDGLIFPLDNFLEEIFFAQKKAQQGNIVLFGVAPTHPEPSYGYIELAEIKNRLAKKKRFLEKPSSALAKELLGRADVLWNTGHILLTAKTFWEEMEKYSPKVACLRDMRYIQAVEQAEFLPDLSLDYALLEPSDKVYVSRVNITWSDMGTWDRIYEAAEKNSNGNVFLGKNLDVGSNNCLVLSEEIQVITLGLEELIVVATKEGVLVAKKGSADQMKQILGALQKEKVSCNG